MTSTEKMTWTFENQSWDRMVLHTVDSYPSEACGILLCSCEKPQHIQEVYPTENATEENPARRYLVDPKAFLEAHKWAEEKDLDICGFYHSHPDHPSAPSEYDRKMAWEGYLYIIISVRGGALDRAQAWMYTPETKHFKEIAFEPNGQAEDTPLESSFSTS